jgi:hypothetical protein
MLPEVLTGHKPIWLDSLMQTTQTTFDQAALITLDAVRQIMKLRNRTVDQAVALVSRRTGASTNDVRAMLARACTILSD